MEPRRHHLSEIPLLFPVLGMVAGIAVSAGGGGMTLWVSVALVAVGIMAGMFARMPRMVFFSLGMAAGVGMWWVTAPGCVALGVKGDYCGEVVDNSDYGSAQRCVVDVGGGVRIGVSLYDYPYLLEPGDKVAFSATLLPAVRETTVPDEYDGRRYAMVNRLSATCVLSEGDLVIQGDADGFRGWLNRVRERFLGYIRHSGLSQPAARFLAAVLLGDNQVDRPVRDDFSRAGLSHTLALSGTHVSAISLLLALLLFPVEIAGNRGWRLWFTMVALWGYALLTGMSPSVVRAVIMASFVTMGKLAGRFVSPLNSLCGAALAILLLQPVALFMPGFQLSFLAVAGILTLLPMVRGWVLGADWSGGRMAYYIVTLIVVPVAAVIATAPLSAWYFHFFPIWFLLSNLVAAFMLPLILCAGGLMLILAAMGFPAGVLVWLVEAAYGVMSFTAMIISGMPGNSLTGNIYFSGWWLLPVYAAIVMLWLGWNDRRKVLVVNGVLLLLVSVALIPASLHGYGKGECHPWRISRGVGVVCRDGGKVYVVTDTSSKYFPEIAAQTETRLADFIGKRGAVFEGVRCDSLDFDGVSVERNRWRIYGKNIWLLRSDTDTASVDVARDDVLLVCAGFRGDIRAVRRRYPDALLVLSPSLPPVRRKRYADELGRVGLPYSLDLPPGLWDKRYSPSVK